MTPIIRPATSADLDAFYGKDRPNVTMRALVADLDGKPIAIAGVSYPKGASPVLFSQLKPEMRRFRKLILKGARQMLAEFKPITALAKADCTEANAGRLLERLGFQHVAGDVYRYEGVR